MPASTDEVYNSSGVNQVYYKRPRLVARCLGMFIFRLTVSSCPRVSTVPLRRPQGGGLRMDARSCAPEITDDDFEAEVLSEDRPVLVFFRAPW